MACDASDMFAVHAALRSAVTRIHRLVSAGIGRDAERAGVLSTYLDTVLQLLHAHHTSEDDLVWPRLLERRPTDSVTITRVAEQHELLHPALAGLEAARSAWHANATPTSDAALLIALQRLEEALLPHLEDEERLIVPMISESLSVEEWREMPGASMSKMDPQAAMLSLGLVLDELAPPARAALEAELPEPVRDAWRSVGQPLHDRVMAALLA